MCRTAATIFGNKLIVLSSLDQLAKFITCWPSISSSNDFIFIWLWTRSDQTGGKKKQVVNIAQGHQHSLELFIIRVQFWLRQTILTKMHMVRWGIISITLYLYSTTWHRQRLGWRFPRAGELGEQHNHHAAAAADDDDIDGAHGLRGDAWYTLTRFEATMWRWAGWQRRSSGSRLGWEGRRGTEGGRGRRRTWPPSGKRHLDRTQSSLLEQGGGILNLGNI